MMKTRLDSHLYNWVCDDTILYTSGFRVHIPAAKCGHADVFDVFAKTGVSLKQPSSKIGMTALHIAASNLSLAAARVLLKFGANSEAVDDLGRKPRECVPEPETFDMVPDAQDLIDKMVKLLSEGLESRSVPAGSLARTSTKSISGRTVMGAMGLKLSDRVVVGNKLGTLRSRLVHSESEIRIKCHGVTAECLQWGALDSQIWDS